MAERLLEEAPAKLNLDLLVLGRRPDGYHELDSLVAFADIGDRLTLAPHHEFRLETTGPFAASLPFGEENVVLKAARRLAALAGGTGGALLRLEKHLPVASGIGGGSADAAAALRGLNRLWSLGLGEPDLAEIGLGLGADVPVCVHGRPARLRGVGERLDPLPALPTLPLVLANALRPVPTGRVFAALAPLPARAPCRTLPPAFDSPAELLVFLEESRNDLEAPALRLEPGIAGVLTALRALPEYRLARMSGSGGSCFAVFPDPVAATRAAGLLRAAHPGWWVVATATREGR